MAAADADEAVVALDDLVRDPEAETGAGDSFGRKEGLEDAPESFRGDAGAVIGDGDADAGTAGFPVVRGDFAERDRAAFADGVDGIADEIGEDLTDFALVRHDEGNGAEVAANLDVLAAEAGVKQGEDGVEELVDVGAGGAGGAAVKAEGLDGDLSDAVEFFLGELEEGAGFVGERELLDEVEAVGDGLEGVVDFVGDGCGKAAGDGELFGAAEDLFALFLEREIGNKGGELLLGFGGFGVEDGNADEDVDPLAGVGDADAFEGLGGDGRLRGVVESLAEVAEGGTEVGEANEAGEDFAAGIAEQTLKGGI